MTERIYYTDSACRTFEARVARSFEHEGRAAVTLDRTAFYPTSGGQPFDTGALRDTASAASIPVIETIDVGDEVVHIVGAPIAEGRTVQGEISWDRRFDHTQQHSGQHVLSGAFERLTGNATVSFHMGTETSTIDLAREATADEITRAEDEANRIVWEDRDVTIQFTSSAEAAALGLRKEPTRAGTLRLVEIADFDRSACGGTHVAKTGSIGMIAVLGSERFKGASRITFVCGHRALRLLRTLRDAVAGSVRVLSVLPPELPPAIERLQQEAKDQRKTIARLQETLAAHEAAALLEGATTIGGVRMLVRVMPGWDAQGLKALAAGATSQGAAIVALLTASMPAQVVIARSDDVKADAAALMRQVVERFGGKGGGKPDLAQGGGLAGDVRAIEWALSGLIEDAIGGP